MPKAGLSADTIWASSTLSNLDKPEIKFHDETQDLFRCSTDDKKQTVICIYRLLFSTGNLSLGLGGFDPLSYRNLKALRLF